MRRDPAIQIPLKNAERAREKKSFWAPRDIKYVRRYIQRKSENHTESMIKRKDMGDYFLCWSLFSNTILYFQTENFFSSTRFTLYQPRIIHEPNTSRRNHTINPRIAGLKRIAIPRTRQTVQKRIIKQLLCLYYRYFLFCTREIPHFWGITLRD